MKKSESVLLRNRNEGGSQIIGIRLLQELASQVKDEAARRGITLKALFIELWEERKKK